MPNPVDVEVRFLSPLADHLLFHHTDVKEELGRPFKYDVTLLSESGDLVRGDLLGQVATVDPKLRRATESSSRHAGE